MTLTKDHKLSQMKAGAAIGILVLTIGLSHSSQAEIPDENDLGHNNVMLPGLDYIDYNLKRCHQSSYDVPWDEELADMAHNYVGRLALSADYILLLRKKITNYSARLAAFEYCSSKSRFFSNNSPLSVGCANKTFKADLEIVCLYKMVGTF